MNDIEKINNMKENIRETGMIDKIADLMCSQCSLNNYCIAHNIECIHKIKSREIFG